MSEYLTVSKQILPAVLHVTVMLAFPWLLVQYGKLSQVLGSMLKLHMMTAALFGFFSFLNQMYKLLSWRPNEFAGNAVVFHLFIIFQGLSMVALAVCTFFLGFDRCFSIMFPLAYSRRGKRLTLLITSLTMSGFVIAYARQRFAGVYTVICDASGCMERTTANGFFYLVVRNVIAVSNLSVGAVLFFLLKKRKLASKANWPYRIFRIVLWTMAFSFLFDFIPHCGSMLLRFFGINSYSTWGSYSMLATSIETFCCVLVHLLTFPRRFYFRFSLFSSRTDAVASGAVLPSQSAVEVRSTFVRM